MKSKPTLLKMLQPLNNSRVFQQLGSQPPAKWVESITATGGAPGIYACGDCNAVEEAGSRSPLGHGSSLDALLSLPLSILMRMYLIQTEMSNNKEAEKEEMKEESHEMEDQKQDEAEDEADEADEE
jgi:hypothetical protein